MALAAGTRLGPYEIVDAVGSGGMGEVYRARDTRLDRTVAIKILTPAFAADPQCHERFDREARSISQLTHPHICTLYDVGTHEGTAFLVLETTITRKVGGC
jgi:serine/threonine protein kinase